MRTNWAIFIRRRRVSKCSGSVFPGRWGLSLRGLPPDCWRVCHRGETLGGPAIPLSMLRIRYARLSLVFIAACCIVGLGGCMPGVIVEGSTMYRTAHTPVRARTVSKARTVSQSRTANLMVHTGTLKPPIPLPDRSLLEPQPSLDCTFKGPLSNPVTVEEMRMKLDYEQQCYRQAESNTRTRLQQLQNSISDATKSTSRRKVKGKRHKYVRHPGSGNHRASGHLHHSTHRTI